jgi:Protein of unknown function (DUF2721)
MGGLGDNPFAILTFIAAPAILINASSVMALGTANRFARAVDRTRQLATQAAGKEGEGDTEARRRTLRQLGYAERRALLLVRALTAFYLSVGSFAAASLASLLGAIGNAVGQEVVRQLALGLALPAGIVGVSGLVCGSGILVWETRMTLAILHGETTLVREKLHGGAAPEK